MDPSSPRHPPAPAAARALRAGEWLLVPLAWTAFAVALAVGYDVREPVTIPSPSLGERLAHLLPFYWLWAAMTPAIVRAAARLDAARLAPGAWLGAHAALAAVASLVQPPAFVAVSVWLGTAWPFVAVGAQIREAAWRHLAGNLLAYACVVAAWSAREYHRCTSEEITRARLEALRRQLQPHFLFNALQGAASLMHRDVAGAERMLELLGDYLRQMLRRDDRELVPVREELELLDLYLGIMRLRFGDRLRVAVDVEPAARDALVPVLVLQPLVENALRHGLERRAESGAVRVSVRARGDRLVVSVADDGAGLPADRPPREGVGLTNTRARLRQLFGDDHAVRLEPVPGGGVRVELSLPGGGAGPAGARRHLSSARIASP